MGCGVSKEELSAHLQKIEEESKQAWEREHIAMASLDKRTKVPHLLVELRNLGFVEIQGKDTGGIFSRLGTWLQSKWNLQKAARDIVPAIHEDDCCGASVKYGVGGLNEWHELCDASYAVGGGQFNTTDVTSRGPFKSRGNEGENNMGLLTMQLANFMTHECGWTLQVCDGGNLGLMGDIREQQIKFKAPHPLNLIAPLIMIELREVGYIEINGPNTNGIHGKLHSWLTSAWRASKMTADREFCEVKYKCNAFHSRGSEGENNMGMCTMQIVDFMVKQCAWTMVTCNASNFGRKGDMREQQLVFRNDEHVQHGENHILVELRSIGSSMSEGGGYIEVNGLGDAGDLRDHLDRFVKSTWNCNDYKPYWHETDLTPFCDKKYTVPQGFYLRRKGSLTNNLGKRTLQLAEFLSQHGWALQLCNGGSITPRPRDDPNSRTREQQIKFTKARTKEKALAPLLMIELRAEPCNCQPPIIVSGHIEISGANINGIYAKVGDFITNNMQGARGGKQSYCDMLYTCRTFRMKEATSNVETKWVQFGFGGQYTAEDRLNGESNIGKWTMRLCDFMVDHIGEWDLIVCNSDNLGIDFGPRGTHQVGGDGRFTPHGVAAREMQLVFRHKPGGRNVFMSAPQIAPLGRAPLQAPHYWREGSKQGRAAHEIIPCTAEESRWMQELMDKTFKKMATRDRAQKLADRFEVVQCLRSEHPAPWDKYALRRKEVMENCRKTSQVESLFQVPKTTMACEGLAQRLSHPTFGNPACQAFLFHGTNPTMAESILGQSFKIDLAGFSKGTMFGPGVYLAESSSKSDEYATDDSGGEYDGLFAVLVCRTVLGRPFVTDRPGNYAEQVTSGNYDCVVGDREKAVGTFREFVIFHEGSVYPEYAVFYRRIYSSGPGEPRAVSAGRVSKAPVPHVMGSVAPVAGSKQWQFQGDDGAWHNFGFDVAARLTTVWNSAASGARSIVQFEIKGTQYSVDLDCMQQKNEKTGKIRPVRSL